MPRRPLLARVDALSPQQRAEQGVAAVRRRQWSRLDALLDAHHPWDWHTPLPTGEDPIVETWWWLASQGRPASGRLLNCPTDVLDRIEAQMPVNLGPRVVPWAQATTWLLSYRGSAPAQASLKTAPLPLAVVLVEADAHLLERLVGRGLTVPDGSPWPLWPLLMTKAVDAIAMAVEHDVTVDNESMIWAEGAAHWWDVGQRTGADVCQSWSLPERRGSGTLAYHALRGLADFMPECAPLFFDWTERALRAGMDPNALGHFERWGTQSAIDMAEHEARLLGESTDLFQRFADVMRAGQLRQALTHSEPAVSVRGARPRL